MSWYSEVHYKPVQRDPKYDYYWQRFFGKIEGNILEIGSSIGNFLTLAPDRIIGVDIDADAIEIARQRGLNAKVMDVCKGLDFEDNSFDAVHMHGVLDHLKDPLFVLRECYRVMRPGGGLVCLTGNAAKYGMREFWDDYTHTIPFTKRSLYQIAWDTGFRDFEILDEYRWIRGPCRLVKHNVISMEKALKIQEFFYKIGWRRYKRIILIAKKNKHD